jgi:hypothetical protein
MKEITTVGVDLAKSALIISRPVRNLQSVLPAISKSTCRGEVLRVEYRHASRYTAPGPGAHAALRSARCEV